MNIFATSVQDKPNQTDRHLFLMYDCRCG